MPGPHCPPRTAQDCSGNLCYTKLMHLFNRFFFNLAVGVGSGGGDLPSMLKVVVWLRLIGSNCKQLLVFVFFINLLYLLWA